MNINVSSAPLQTKLSHYNNAGYKPGKGILICAIWYIINAIFFNSYIILPYKLKAIILKLFGAKVGKGIIIKPRVNIKYPWKLSIGNYVWIGEGVWIDNLDDIIIGSNVCLSQGCLLLTGNHNYKKPTFDLMTNKIVIEDGVWIGARSIVCPGVTCKSHAVLTVGSVANTNLEPYGIYKGNPAERVKHRI